jgi:hypothetical protein
MLIELQTQDLLSNGVMHGLIGGRRMDAAADPGFLLRLDPNFSS